MLTEVAGEGGPDLAPQKFSLCPKFRNLIEKLYKRNLFTMLYKVYIYIHATF